MSRIWAKNMEISRKSELRQEILKLRKELDPQLRFQMDQEIFKILVSKRAFCQAQSVYCYADIGNEAGTGQILQYLWDRKIKVALPKVQGKEMKFYQVTQRGQLEKGCMGIMEPMDGLAEVSDPDGLVIVPGLAFDREGYRMGYGGGYYDRFFSREPDHVKIGIGYGFQLVERVPRDPWDVRLDDVVIGGQLPETLKGRDLI